MNYRFDRDLFAQCVDEHRPGTTLAQIAAESGVSAATLSRVIASKGTPDITTLAALCTWMQKDPNVFFRAPTTEAAPVFVPDTRTQLLCLLSTSGIAPQVIVSLMTLFDYAVGCKESQ